MTCMEVRAKIENILFATDFPCECPFGVGLRRAFAQHFHATIMMRHVVLLYQTVREVEVGIAGLRTSRLAAY